MFSPYMCKNATKPVLQLLEAFYLAHAVKFWRGCFSTQGTPHPSTPQIRPTSPNPPLGYGNNSDYGIEACMYM